MEAPNLPLLMCLQIYKNPLQVIIKDSHPPQPLGPCFKISIFIFFCLPQFTHASYYFVLYFGLMLLLAAHNPMFSMIFCVLSLGFIHLGSAEYEDIYSSEDVHKHPVEFNFSSFLGG